MVAFSTLSVLLSIVSIVVALSPGSYNINNVQFPLKFVGGTNINSEGVAIATFTNVSTIWKPRFHGRLIQELFRRRRGLQAGGVDDASPNLIVSLVNTRFAFWI